MVGKLLAAPLFAIVARHNDQTIGCAMMQAISDWLSANGADNAMVALITCEGLTSFYEAFGFRPSFGMQRKIVHGPKPLAEEGVP